MTKKIFRSICFVAAAVLLVSLVLIMGLLYDYFSRGQQRQLAAQTDLAAQGVIGQGMEYFNGLELNGCRITWIDANGTVLYDSASDPDEMENHLDREEIKEAMATGQGDSIRYSNTLTERLCYHAQRLPDGTVLRLASAQYTAWVLLMGVMQPVLVVALLSVLLSFLLASRLSAKLMEPLNQVNLDDPLKSVAYEELRPLLSRIDSQQHQLKQDKAALEKNEQIRRDFTANVSHELKTPLHSISGYAELLAGGLVKEEDVQPFAGKIYRESRRMTSLVEDIIELSHLDSGAADMQREETDLYLIAQNAVDSLALAAEAAHVTLTLTGESAKLWGVPQLLYGICYNLCDNAIKYNRANGSVNLTVRDKGQELTLTVSDTGIGIPPEHQDRVFERFYRVDKSHSKEVGGTGLGLSIVKHSAMIHQAKIEMESVPGGSTAFTVHFPKNVKQQ